MLAGHLGKSLGEVLELPALEVAEWAAYHRGVSPIGAYRSDIQAGIVASTVANVNRSKGTRAFKATDFMIKPPESKRQKTARMRAALEAAITAGQAKAKPKG